MEVTYVNEPKRNYTVAGTDIDEVKRKNANSGMSYNEVKEWIAKTTGGHDTAMYSNTDLNEVRRNNKQSES